MLIKRNCEYGFIIFFKYNCTNIVRALYYIFKHFYAHGARLAERVAAFERSLIAGAIAAHGGRLRAVYETLGISRKTLYEKMQKYGLDRRLIVEAPEDMG